MKVFRSNPPHLYNKIAVLLLSVVLLATTTGITSYAEDVSGSGAGGVKPHEHQWADTADDTYHWQKCQFEGCTQIRNKAAHSYKDNGHSSCADPVEYAEICQECGHYHVLTKTHIPDGIWHARSDRCLHYQRCLDCKNQILTEWCTASSGHVLGCRGYYIEGYSHPYEGTCVKCGEQHNNGHGVTGLRLVRIDRDVNNQVTITPNSWELTARLMCEDCGEESADITMTVTKGYSDNVSDVVVQITPDANSVCYWEDYSVVNWDGSCQGIVSNIYPTGKGTIHRTRNTQWMAEGRVTYYNYDRPEVDRIVSNVYETHGIVDKILSPDNFTPQRTAWTQFSMLTPYEWSKPSILGDITFTDEVKVDGWTTQAKVNFTATDAFSHMIYYTAGDIDIHSTNWGSSYSEGTSWNISFMPEVEADENGQWVTFAVRDSAYNVGTKQVFLKKWDHKPPTALTTEANFSSAWSRTKSGIVSCTDMGIGEVVFEFNDFSDPTKAKTMTDNGNGKFSLKLNLEVQDGVCIGPNGTEKSLYYTDGVGNPTTQYIKFYRFDNARPTVAFVNPTQPYTLTNGKAIVKVTGEDATCTNPEDLGAPGSGIKCFGYSTQADPDNITWAGIGTTQFEITKADWYHFWSMDNVGNISEKIPAIYIPVDWYIEYHNTNGSTGNIPKQTVTWNETATLSDGKPLRLNHSVLLGWTTDKNTKRSLNATWNYNLSQQVTNVVNPGETLHLYAVWRPWWYNVTFHNNIPGQPDVTTTRNDVKYEYDVEYYPLRYPEISTLAGFQRDGYYIDRWSTSTKLAGNGYSSGSEYSTGGDEKFMNLASDTKTAHLYAIWKGNPYTLNIHDNYSDCHCDVETYTLHVGEDFTLPQTSNKHGSNAVLLGYSHSPEFTTQPEYKAGKAIRDLTTIPNAVVDLYRIWDNPPTITSPAHLNIDRATAAAAGITFTETGAVKQADLELLLLSYAHAKDKEYTMRYGTDEIPAGKHNGYRFEISRIDPVQIKDDLQQKNSEDKVCNYVITYIVVDDSGNYATSKTELLFGNPGDDKDSWITILTDTN